MVILGIETSCDDTAASIVIASGSFDEPRFAIASSIVSSQAAQHAAWGGVVPMLAKREHEKNLPAILAQALSDANVTPNNIDAIAVTKGPGLEPALWAGIAFAEKTAREWKKPLIGINHMEGHIVAAVLSKSTVAPAPKIVFPALALLISGGHTELVLVHHWLKYQKLGATRDDAIGEAFDKVARLLGFPYPGGPHISHAAEKGVASGISLPRPMLHSGNYDFSYSGLKTAVLYYLRDRGELSQQDRSNLCREFELAATDVLIAKTRRALAEFTPASLIIGGGVIANTHIRASFTELISSEFPHIHLHVPAISFAGDNAAMIAAAAYIHLINGETTATTIRAQGHLSIA
ncbi:MAG: tRNA (adenosine(37)-N6)-threonylcarbamoyltransferase complex transferase subunit TsaD [Candidatus Vogelbacteria bacterium]|nr:tRNA (adenosine(37)-N6)-threonylcarbamoyltransferase complex transferase subunit TsaD [Candidatus Vogelbacteria bacterium]